MEGGEEENTYPNKAWLPASGVQRGSLYTMPGSGDPQTPGIAALTGMYRRPHNESELPPIPAHPMGYGDAIKFLQEMSGNRLGKKIYEISKHQSCSRTFECMRIGFQPSSSPCP